MIVLNETKSKFHELLGELFYSIAQVDGKVRIEEEEAFKDIIQKDWTSYFDKFNHQASDYYYQIFSSFKRAEKNKKEIDLTFQKFVLFKMENESLFSNEIIQLILKTANSIAQAVNGRGKKELQLLFQLEKELKKGWGKIDKAELKENLIERQTELISAIQKEIQNLHSGIDLDEEDTIDPEDFSHQAELSSIEKHLQQKLELAKEEKEYLQRLSTKKSDEVETGALLQLENKWIYISIAKPEFKFSGQNILSISPFSPLFQKILHKKKGDKIKIGPQTEIIKNII